MDRQTKWAHVSVGVLQDDHFEMPPNPDSHDLDRQLHQHFGLSQFRPGQREVISSVLEGQDVLCVMPTGGGKSLCYQLPALLLPGLTLVISPLIALMKDQVDTLVARGVKATLLNSTLDLNEQNARLAELAAGKYTIAYVAPERFRSKRFVEMMARIKPSLFAIDEAHCISSWGHDFRPDYARLGEARKALGMPTCIALTATATDVVRRDITDQLDLRDPAQFVTGFDRPNLSYRAIEARRDVDKFQVIQKALDRNPGPSVIYASSRKRCEEISLWLEQSQARSAVVYHAGLPRDERESAQDRFMSSEAEIVVATNAFGMGVDKPDIRSVIHFNMPGTLEAYYQEAGRAGRDGEAAECLLIYSPGDRFLQELFIEDEYPPPALVFQIYDFLRKQEVDPIEYTLLQIRDLLGLTCRDSAIGTCLGLLERAGVIERFPPRENMAIIRLNLEADSGSLVDQLSPQAHVQRLVLLAVEGLVNGRFDTPVYFNPDELSSKLGLDRNAVTRALKIFGTELPIDYIPPFRGHAIRVRDRERKLADLGVDFKELDRRKAREFSKLETMISYAQSRTCRRAYLLGYFGDTSLAQCGNCDRCRLDSGRPRRGEETSIIDTPAGRELLQKILSGVFRAKGRFGKILIAQMLLGSGLEKVERSGLASLSTFGILAESGFTRSEVTLLIEALSSIGMIESNEVDRFKPVIKLSENGLAWLKSPNLKDLSLPIPDHLAAKVRIGGLLTKPTMQPTSGSSAEDTSSKDDDPSDSSLRSRLIDLRRELAKREGLSAAYIYSNETLDAIVRERPANPQSLATIKGIGPSKLERFGKDLLQTVNEQSPSVKSPAVVEDSSGEVATEIWTRKLIETGFSIEEAAAIRGLPRSTIEQHLGLA